MNRRTLAVAALLVLAGRAQAQVNPPSAVVPNETQVEARDCVVQLIQDVKIPSQVEGLLVQLDVDDGAMVEAEQVIGMVDGRQAALTKAFKEAEARVAEIEANNDVNVRNAIDTARIEETESQQFEILYNKNAAPFLDWQKQKLEASRAKLSIELATLQQSQAKAELAAKQAELNLAELEIARRQIIAPFRGVIVKVSAHKGEWVQSGAPIAQLVSLEKLRIHGDVDGRRTSGQSVVGAPVEVRIQVTDRREETFRAKIGYVSSMMNFTDQKFPVWAEIENRIENGDWVVKPGMRARLVIYPKQELALKPQ
jgi:multidrug efflux pump subunit AcrA (membrane-fusion protein)